MSGKENNGEVLLQINMYERSPDVFVADITKCPQDIAKFIILSKIGRHALDLIVERYEQELK